MNVLLLIIVTLFISLFMNLSLKKLGVSPIVGYILTGAVMGSTLGLADIIDRYTLHEIAEFGIVFLMFSIGLEFSLHHLNSMRREVFLYGGLQVLLTGAFFAFSGIYLFDLGLKSAIVIGAALALSSTAIVLRVLNDNGDIHRPYGRNALGILLFQDLAVIPILLMIAIFANPDAELVDLLTNTLISGAMVLAILFFLGKYATEKFLGYIVDAKTDEFFISAIILIVLSSAMLAHVFGFSYSLGAFVAGMLIAETKYKHQIEADLVPFRDLLLGLFFITVGLQLDFGYFFANILLIFGLTAAILFFKALLIFGLIWFFSFPKRAIKTALALAQVGEFSFAVLELAKISDLISNDLNQLMIAVVVISLIFTSLSIRYVRLFSNFLIPERTELAGEPFLSADINHHIVVCGYSLLGQKVVKQIKNKGLPYIAIEHDRNHVKTGLDRGDVVFFGNAASKVMLNSVFIKNAMAVVIAIDNDEKVRLICESIRAIDPRIPIVVKVSHQEQINDLEYLGISDFVNENESVAKLLVSKAMKVDVESNKSSF